MAKAGSMVKGKQEENNFETKGKDAVPSSNLISVRLLCPLLLEYAFLSLFAAG